jgi:hypothetical protein
MKKCANACRNFRKIAKICICLFCLLFNMNEYFETHFDSREVPALQREQIEECQKGLS